VLLTGSVVALATAPAWPVYASEVRAVAQPTPASSATSSEPQAPGASTADPQPSSVPSAISSEAALSRGMALYESGQYEECASTLTQWLKAKDAAGPAQLEQVDQAKIYLGACLIASAHVQQADRVFGDALRGNPQMRAPDSLTFPQTVVDRFLRVREQFLTDIRRDEQSRIRDAEQHAKEQDAKTKREIDVREQLRAMARQETIVERNRRWLATVPFGVGQFQNGDTAAGWAFLTAEVVLAGTCITAVVLDEHLANKSREPGINPAELRAKRLEAYRIILLSSWGFLGVAVGGIVHAHWRFVPERRTIRMRPLPADLDTPAQSEAKETTRQGRATSNRAFSVGITIGPTLGIAGSF